MESNAFYLSLWLAIALLHVLIKGLHSLDIQLGLVFTEEPQDVVVTKGQAFVWNCSAENTDTDSSSGAAQPATIAWHKDGHEITDTRRYVLSNGSLYFKRVVHRKQRGRSDEGYYECVARNRLGLIVSRKAHLQVASMSRVSGVPGELSVVEGEVVRLQCPINAQPSATYTWEQDKNSLPQNNRYTVVPSGVLQISGVAASDAGSYRCSATAAHETRSSIRMELTVQPATSHSNIPLKMLTLPQQYVTKLVGDTVLLECAATGIPKPDISWKYQQKHADGTLSEAVSLSGGVAGYSVVGQGNLQISDVSVEDAGLYVCSASTSSSTKPVATEIHLKILEPPQLILAPESVGKPIARTTRFTCQFSGSPTPNITWLKNGKEILHNGRVKVQRGHLIISQTDPRDSGYYQCRAENEAGVAQGTARLYIIPSANAPDPPTVLIAEVVSSTAIRLSWTPSPPKNKRPTLAYSVHYLLTKGGAELQRVEQGTNVLIEQLMPNTNYTFYVVAYNNESASLHSKTITQVTDEDVPIAAPSVKVSSLGRTSLKVEWEELPIELARGIISEYKVLYRRHGSRSVTVETMAASTRSYIIIDLEPDVQYDVRVEGCTKAGYPELDEKSIAWVTGLTGTQKVVGVPLSPWVETKVLNSTAIQVNWQPDTARRYEILGYKLFFQKTGESRKTIIHTNDVTSHTLTKLEPNSWYTISVMAFNEQESEPTVKQVQTPAEGEGVPTDGPALPPPPPRRLVVEPLTESSMHVTWQAPPTGDITQYTLRYKTMSADPLRLNSKGAFRYLQTEKLEAVVSNLKAYTMYEFSVRADTSTTEGQYSSPTRARTLEGTPTAPVNVRLTLLGPGLVDLSWSQPLYRNGVIVSYIILYSKDKTLPEKLWTSRVENGTVTTSRVERLETNAIYFFRMRAATGAGSGPPTALFQVDTGPYGTNPSVTADGLQSGGNEHREGIIVGVSIGGACILISIIIVLLRNRCCPPHLPPLEEHIAPRRHKGNGYIPKGTGNGNGYLPHGPEYHLTSRDVHEMDSFTPMLAAHHIQENENSDPKGGYGNLILTPQKPPNGIHMNGLRVVYQPNGQVKTNVTSENSAAQEVGPQVPPRTTSLHQSQLSGGATTSCGEPTEAGHGDHTCSLEDIDHDDAEPPDERGPMLCSTPARSAQPPPSYRQDCGPQTAPNTGSYNNRAPSVNHHPHYCQQRQGGEETGEEQQALLSQNSTATSQSSAPPVGGATTTSTTSGHHATHVTQRPPSGCSTQELTSHPPHNSHSNCASEHSITNSQSRSQGNSHGLVNGPSQSGYVNHDPCTTGGTTHSLKTSPQDAVYFSSKPHRTANHHTPCEQVLSQV